MKDKFFYRHWWLYYLLFFLLLGVLIYALLWHPKCEVNYPPSYYQQPNTPENPTPPTDGSRVRWLWTDYHYPPAWQ